MLDADTATTIERLPERTREVLPEGTAPLWHVDPRALERAGMLPVEAEAKDRLADELRRIKRPLLDNVNGKGAKPITHAERIVVSSAAPDEGKTFTAMNLAMSLARERDFEVLLVDGDIPKSDVTRILGLEGQPGLMDVLVDEQRHPADVIVRTDVPNLSVVPAGQHHALAAELFGSLRMQYVLEELGGRSRRRLVVFDSSPLLAVSESQVLVSHMGQVVVVVAAGRTHRSALASALEEMSDSQYVGLILNMSRLPASENHYDRYYGRYARITEGAA
ncbi:MAG TPA: AAA family ATPase [Rhodanobacteraceae bacterium]|nr:AAA family ATPase [Rhodanobacteraceae bacterium]